MLPKIPAVLLPVPSRAASTGAQPSLCLSHCCASTSLNHPTGTHWDALEDTGRSGTEPLSPGKQQSCVDGAGAGLGVQLRVWELRESTGRLIFRCALRA